MRPTTPTEPRQTHPGTRDSPVGGEPSRFYRGDRNKYESQRKKTMANKVVKELEQVADEAKNIWDYGYP